MPRKPRIHFPGALYHVMLRGNGGQIIFNDTKDKEYFNYLVEDGVKRYGHNIYAYCWMSNHVHLAIEVNMIPLSKIIQNLSFRYTRHINKKFKRVGHLFQGRYKAILIEKDSYLLELIRYIHLNPIRAKMVDKPEDYLWSSHRCYLGLVKIPWVESQKPLMMYSSKKSIAIENYIRHIKESMKQKNIDFDMGEIDPRIIGNDDFVEKIISIEVVRNDFLINLDKILEVTCNLLSIPENKLKLKTKRREITLAKHIIAYINKHYGKVPNCDLAKLFALEPSSLSKAITKIEITADSKVIGRVKEVIRICKSL